MYIIWRPAPPFLSYTASASEMETRVLLTVLFVFCRWQLSNTCRSVEMWTSNPDTFSFIFTCFLIVGVLSMWATLLLGAADNTQIPREIIKVSIHVEGCRWTCTPTSLRSWHETQSMSNMANKEMFYLVEMEKGEREKIPSDYWDWPSLFNLCLIAPSSVHDIKGRYHPF